MARVIDGTLLLCVLCLLWHDEISTKTAVMVILVMAVIAMFSRAFTAFITGRDA
jgi:hypothetical protein